MPGPVRIVRSLGDLADLVAALPAAGALPLRTVLVPTERHAHALRRALVRTGRERALAGTRFVGPLTLALEVVRDGGLDLVPGEEALRPARLLALFSGALALEHFDLGLLRGTPGWPAAFASSLSDLEAAGLRLDGLPASSAHWRDLAAIWRLLDADAGPSSTAARIYLAASELLSRGARPATGPVVAAVSGRETAALAGFLDRLPDRTLAIWAARPLRERHASRVAALHGPDAAAALASAPLPEAVATERDLLARFLFASPDLLADPARPRSGGADGTVELSEHSGIEEELEAAASWVAREILERRTPLEQVAVLTPSRGPLLPLLAARLGRLPWEGGPLPIHVAGGLPLVARAGGARALALVRALAAFLPAAELAALLPSLHVPVADRSHLSIDEATTLAWSLGTAGGNAGEPALALAWSLRAEARERALAAEVEAGDPDDREGRARRDALEVLRAARPALDALVCLARLVVAGAPLRTLAPALVAFLEGWLLDPGPGAPVHALLAAELEGARRDPATGALSGLAALALVEERLASLHLPAARFGEPALFVGPVASAAGLDFEAVRLVGLAEGALPSAVREDPVLPEPMRLEAHPLLVPVPADRVTGQLHALDGAIHAARRAVALSFPRCDLARSEREPSSLLLEVGAALARPDPGHEGAIPDLDALARTAFGPARAAAAAFRAAHPVGEVAWQDRAAGAGEARRHRIGDVPPAWSGAPVLSVEALLERRAATALGPDTGLLGGRGPFPAVPGLTADRTISASALGELLGCPLSFLLKRILSWSEPAEAPSVRQLEPKEYGSIFHRTAERFYRQHGADFVARRRTLAHWKHAAQALGDEELDAFLESRPLVGEGVFEKERNRLRRDLARFLDQDWRLPLDRFVDVERAFGEPAPLVLDAGGIPLHVRGSIDRIDVAGGRTLLRDLKTGKPHPRQGEEEGLDPGLDLQLGLYGIVARELSGAWHVPARVQVAYAYVGHREERAWRGDYDALEAATRGWLALSARLLSDRSFPPTPDVDACTYCAFRPVCGPETPARAAASRVRGAAGAYLALFAGDEEEDA
jgi:hypothetical protein